ncbi:hypothetical protein [Candidatus Lokiarchaeum ossiferum]|uniref:hypothetical protein n=1 Tax=Candidatus Lokiarchaeum ossiferum TaxID=2951803 RepID=UPI00352FD40F
MKKTIRYLFIFMIFSMMFGQGSAQDNYPVSLQVGDKLTYKGYYYDSSYADPDRREATSWTVFEITDIYDEGNSTLVKSKSTGYLEKPTNDTETDKELASSYGSGFFANLSETESFEFLNLIPSNTKIWDFSNKINQRYGSIDGVKITYFDENYGVEIYYDLPDYGYHREIARYTSTGILIHHLNEYKYKIEGIKQERIHEFTLENSLSSFDGSDQKSSSTEKSIPAYSGLTLSIFSLVGIFFLLSHPKIKQH